MPRKSKDPQAVKARELGRQGLAQIAEQLREVQRRKARVLEVREDGEYVTVEFVRDNGELVSGDYKLYGWNRAPAEFAAKVYALLASPPQTILKARPPKPGGLPRS